MDPLVRDRLVALLHEYQELVDAQAEEIVALKAETCRLASLLDTEVKALALGLLARPAVIPSKVEAPPPPSRPSRPGRPIAERPCVDCGQPFLRTKRRQVSCAACIKAKRDASMAKAREQQRLNKLAAVN